MADASDDSSFKSKFGRVLDSIDSVSRKFEDSIKDRLERKKEMNDSFSTAEDEESEEPDAESLLMKTQGGIEKVGRGISSSLDNARFAEKASGFGGWMKRTGRSIGSGLKSVASHLPYIIPATVIFQTALWLAYLSEGSISHDLVSSRVEKLGDSGQDVAILITFIGAIGAYLISLDFNSQHSIDAFSLHSDVVDVMVILLVLSSVLYLLKKFHSLYYLSLVFIGSVVLRMLDVENFTYDWIVIVLSSVGAIGFISAVSIPLYNDKRQSDEGTSEIDISLLIESDDSIAESSYLDARVIGFGSDMEQAPVSKPSRPRRRSEYELYEWVLLLANLILWPSIVVISVILGSNTEVNGSTYNMDDNYLMLLGPLLLTLFFFTILYKMDANARDGSLYAAEKQAYLTEMEKYLKARTTYLELVTLQAEMKKQEIIEDSSEE